MCCGFSRKAYDFPAPFGTPALMGPTPKVVLNDGARNGLPPASSHSAVDTLPAGVDDEAAVTAAERKIEVAARSRWPAPAPALTAESGAAAAAAAAPGAISLSSRSSSLSESTDDDEFDLSSWRLVVGVGGATETNGPVPQPLSRKRSFPFLTKSARGSLAKGLPFRRSARRRSSVEGWAREVSVFRGQWGVVEEVGKVAYLDALELSWVVRKAASLLPAPPIDFLFDDSRSALMSTQSVFGQTSTAIRPRAHASCRHLIPQPP